MGDFPPAPSNPPVRAISGEVGDNDKKVLETHYFTHMSDNQAKAMKDVSKNTYAVPARNETYRFMAAVVLVGFVLYELIPVFIADKPQPSTLAWVIVGSLAILSASPVVKAIVKAIQGGD